MTEFDDTHLTKDFSDQPITSLTDLANRMRGPQYRSALASQDRPMYQRPETYSEPYRAGYAPSGTAGIDAQAAPADAEAFEPAIPRAQRDPFADAAEAWESQQSWENQQAWQAEANSDVREPAAYDAGYHDPQEQTFWDPLAASHPPVADYAPHSDLADASQSLDAQAIDAALSDLSPDSRDWQRVAWNQEGPLSGHLVNGNLRATRSADLKAALQFDYAADDQDDQPYVPAYRPEARVPGFARTQDAAANQQHLEPQPAVGHDMRAAGEAMAQERHSVKQAELGYRLRQAGSGVWRFCRAASLPQMALIAGGVASSVVMGLVIWSLVSEPSLREPLYLAARPGPEKQIPADPGGMHIANLGMSVLSNGEESGAVQIIEGNRSSVMDLSLAVPQIPASGGDLESIDDLILAQRPSGADGAGTGASDAPASIDQLIALASLDGSAAASALPVPLPASLEQNGNLASAWPPLPRRKEAAHGQDRSAVEPAPAVGEAMAPAFSSPMGDLGMVSAAAPLSKNDDLGALVEEVEADPIWQLLMNDGQLSGHGSPSEVAAPGSDDLGEGAMPEGRSEQESPAALILRNQSLEGLQEAGWAADQRSDMAPLFELDGGLHGQAGLLGNFANWIVPGAQAVSEQLAQLRADGQGGLVAAPEAPAPQATQQQDADENVVVPDGPWSPPLLPAEAIEPFGLQLASYRSLSSARRSWEKLQAKHPSLLKDLVLRVQQAQIAGRGTYYRLQVGPFPNELTALDVCQQLRQQGHRSCILVKKRK